MQPDAHAAMRDALALGPAHCPPDLFAGPVDAILLGLKAHANTIAHARYRALEETFPRTRDLMGGEVFHAASTDHLADPANHALAIADMGRGFSERLAGPARCIAAVELAWLEAHGAADAPPFDLAAVALLDAQCVASAMVARHPAARLVALDSALAWEDEEFDAAFVLVTRPRATIALTSIDEPTAGLLASLASPCSLGAMLERDAAAATTLVGAGALTPFAEILL